MKKHKITKLHEYFFADKFKSLIPVAIFITTFFIYFNNLSHSVFAGDSGDFLSAIITNGIPHPSGYPLYTLTGILFKFLITNGTSAFKVGITSAVFASFGVVLMYLITNLLTNNRFLSFVTSMILAFLYPYWIYAVTVEVFSLHSLFILLIIFLTLKYLIVQKTKYLLLLALTYGLSLSNNLTIILIISASVLVIFLKNWRIITNIKIIIFCFLAFLIGLTPYLYIPIAASHNPEVNWDRAYTLKNFTDLVLRKDYGWVHKDDTPFFPLQSLYSFFIYWKEHALGVFIPLIILGLFKLGSKKSLPIFLLVTLSIIFIGPVFIIYAKTPSNSLSSLSTLERFYTSPFFILIILLPLGILYLSEILQKFITSSYLKKLILFSVFFAYALIPLNLYIKNKNSTNLSNVDIGDNLAFDVLRSLEPNSFLFVVNDEFAFNTLYVQHEYNFRKDVTIPGRNTGFEKFLSVSNIMQSDKIRDYLTENRNTVKQEDLYGGIVSLLESGYSVYSTVPKLIKEDKLGTLGTIPHGMVYKFAIGSKSIPIKESYLNEQNIIWDKYNLGMFEKHSGIVGNSLSLSNIKRHYAEGYKNLANFMKMYYKDEEAYKHYIDLAIDLDPVLN